MKAYFDSAVQVVNNKADQVGRSAIQNDDMMNVEIIRIDDALARLARLESAPTASFTASHNSQGQHHLHERVDERGELRSEDWTCLP